MVRFDKSTSDKGEKYVRDLRGQGGRRRRSSGGGGGLGGGKAVGGLGGIILLILGAFFGLDLGGGSGFDIENAPNFDGGQVPASGEAPVIDPAQDPDADTVALMKGLMFDVQDTWAQYFDQAGLNYTETSLTIFEDSVDTNGCGRATSGVGPFYCPAPGDMGVYVDLGFYDELSTRFGAPGDFAQAYVIAHEIGHHIQAITGISDGVKDAQGQDPSNKNEYSIRQELQADCFAGVWAHSANARQTRDTGQDIIQPNDIEEGLAAAASVGDDRIQEQAGMRIDPHTWTHGSSEQRIEWFTRGFETGDPEKCDTFS